MSVYQIDPLTDNRWSEFVARHPRASPFHQGGWLDSLARTYSYEPIALTSTPPGAPLQDAIVLCRVSSWLTGTRLVSLPFADHCDPLVSDENSLQEFTSWLKSACDRENWKYVELRPITSISSLPNSLLPGCTFYHHTLDLNASREQIIGRMHKNCVQRMIRRAERERLSYEAGCSQKLLDVFYYLLVKTRRRHKLVPQPRVWFRNLARCMGDNVRVWVARKGDVPVASILSLRHRQSIVYKYGCSDEKYHHLGSMPFLFWQLIEESRASDATEIDLGRSDLNNEGLVRFKDRLGASRMLLRYFRYLPKGKQYVVSNWDSKMIWRFLSILPDAALPVAGKALYRHIG